MGLEAHRPIRRCDRGLGEGTVAATEREGGWRRGSGKEESELGTERWCEARAQVEMSRILVWMTGRRKKPT